MKKSLWKITVVIIFVCVLFVGVPRAIARNTIIDGDETDGEGNLIGIKLDDQTGGKIFGGTQGILSDEENESSEPEPSPSASPEPTPSVLEVEGVNFYMQIEKEDPASGEYPIKIDGYTADIAMIMEYYRVEDVTPETILAIDDQHTIGAEPETSDIEAGNLDSILSDRTTIADYYGLEEHEIFRGFDMQQLRRRLKGYKYGDNSPVLIHFGLSEWGETCSFVLDYKYDEDGLQNVDTYRYISRYVAYRCETGIDDPIDYDGSHLYICSMVALSYKANENDEITEITVFYPYSPYGQGAKVTENGMRLTDGTLVPEINLSTIRGYMFFDKE